MLGRLQIEADDIRAFCSSRVAQAHVRAPADGVGCRPLPGRATTVCECQEQRHCPEISNERRPLISNEFVR